MQSLIFCGDLVLPFGTKVNYDDVLPLFSRKQAVVNLEGCILPNEKEVKNNKWTDKYSLYSSPDVIRVLKDLNVKYASFCNNHILDYNHDIQYSVNLLEHNGISMWGLDNHDIKETVLNGKKTYIVTFSTFANEHSLNIYDPDKLVSDIKRLKSNEDCYVVVYPHWGIEKLEHPEPADREHAHRCIDAGADIIIGHHPHIIQGIEVYKGKHIIYSVGNFMLPQTYYGSKKLTYKNEYILNELIVEWDGTNITLYPLYYNRDTNTLLKNHDFDVDELYSYFKTNPTTDDYNKFFRTKVGLLDRVVKMRKEDSRSGEIWCYRRRKIFRNFRKLLINLGLHKPE